MLRSFVLKITTIAAMAALLFSAGCDTDLGTTPEFGTLEVRLHDAPGDFKEVNIHVDSVMVNREEDEDEGWVTISEPDQQYNLLELTNGNFEVLGIAELEAGTYNQIRLILNRENNNVVLNNDEVHELFVPSGEQTGVKLNVQMEISGGSEMVLLLDFDAKRSVVRTGQGQAPMNYLLKPVVRASILDEVGSIAGTVLPAEARSVVYAVSGEDTLSTTYADVETGEFKLMGLEEGTYSVVIEPREEGYLGTEVVDVEVLVDEITDLGTIELEEDTEDDS